MLMVSPGYTKLTSKDYDAIVFDSMNRQPEEYRMFANIQNMDGAYIKEAPMAGLSKLRKMFEGQNIETEDFIEGASKEITPNYWGLGVQITDIMEEDDRTGHMKKALQELGKAAAYSRDLEWFDLLNTGAVTTYRTAYDGYALFSDSHKTLDNATTVDNNGTAASLSKTSLQAALNFFDKLKNHRSVPIAMRPRHLVIPPDLRFIAKEICDSELDPDTANNAVNSVKGELTYSVVHYLTSTTAWYVLTDKEYHDLRFIWRRQPKTQMGVDIWSGNKIYKLTARYIADFIYFYGAYYNAGA